MDKEAKTKWGRNPATAKADAALRPPVPKDAPKPKE